MTRDALTRWLKCILCTLILVLWINCIFLLCLACWIRDNVTPIVIIARETQVGNFYLNSFFPVLFPVLIATSCLSLVIGCLGCCGTCAENKVALRWFFFAILISLCVEISAVVWGRLDWKTHWNEEDVELLYQSAKQSERYERSWFIHAWSNIHEKFQCCGVYSPDDWADMPHLQATCLRHYEESPAYEYPGCGENLLKYLTESSPVRALPWLAAIIGTTQIICLIITVKLWMITRIASSPKLHIPRCNSAQTQGCNQPTLPEQTRPTVPETSQRLAPKKAFSSNPWTELSRDTQTYCHQCALRAYEETTLMSSSVLETEYQRMWERTAAHSPRRLQKSYRSSEKATRTENLGRKPGGYNRTSSQPSLGLMKSASYNLPTTWRSSSSSSMNYQMREFHSASLPRKQYTNSPKWRHRVPGSYTRRLSTIRASGVPVASESSTDVSPNEEELGGSRCYNTEIGSSASDVETSLFRYVSEDTHSTSPPEDRTLTGSYHQSEYPTL